MRPSEVPSEDLLPRKPPTGGQARSPARGHGTDAWCERTRPTNLNGAGLRVLVSFRPRARSATNADRFWGRGTQHGRHLRELPPRRQPWPAVASTSALKPSSARVGSSSTRSPSGRARTSARCWAPRSARARPYSLLSDRAGSISWKSVSAIAMFRPLRDRRRVAAQGARIPVLIDGASHHREAALPDDLKPLAWHHAIPVRADTFRSDLDQLIGFLKEFLDIGPTPSGSDPASASQAVGTRNGARQERIKVDAKIIHGAPDGWFNPGAGRHEWFQGHRFRPRDGCCASGRVHDGPDDYD